MTRQEFIDDVTTFYELYSFCSDEEIYGVLDNYFDGGDLDEEVEYDLGENRDISWRDLSDYLSDIDTGCDFYERCGSFEYYGYGNCGDTFEELKQEVLDIADERGLFEKEEEDETDEPQMELEELWFEEREAV